MMYEAGYRENWLRGGVRPAIYSTLHTFVTTGPILDLSSSKWPEGAAFFIINIVHLVFHDIGEKIDENETTFGKWDNAQIHKLSHFPRFSPRYREKINRTIFLIKNTASSGHFELLRSKIGPLVTNVCKIEENIGPLPPPEPIFWITGFIWCILLRRSDQRAEKPCFR